MREHELDHILLKEREIVPSVKFTMSVMDAVRSEAATPPPLSFPWVRAWPGLIAGAILIFWTIIESFQLLGVPRTTAAASIFQSWIDRLAPILNTAESAGIGWVILSLIVTCACWELTQRVTGKRA